MNVIYKKLLIAFTASQALASCHTYSTEPVTLHNTLIHALDGKPFGFNGNTLHDIIIFHARLNRFQYGHKTPRANPHEGLFVLNDTFLTLDEAAREEKNILEVYQNRYAELDAQYVDMISYSKEKNELEKKLLHEHKAIKDEASENSTYKKLKNELTQLKLKHVKDKLGYENALKELDKNFKQEIAPFQTILIQAADQLLVFVEPFLDNIRAIKGFLVAIINEWHDAHKRHDSALTKWKHAADGKEFEEFSKDITTINQLITFCDDLRSLMRDIVHSCPLGLAQYKEMQKK